MTETWPGAVSGEQYRKLVRLAVARITDASAVPMRAASLRPVRWPGLVSRRPSWLTSAARQARCSRLGAGVTLEPPHWTGALVVHPGKYVHETPWLPALGENQCRVVYGITRAVIEELYGALMYLAGTP